MTSQMDEMPRKPYIKPAIEEVTLRLQEAVLGGSQGVDSWDILDDDSVWNW